MPTDIPAVKPTPTFASTIQGIVALTLVAFFVFGGAALGWHAGVALARVLGI